MKNQSSRFKYILSLIAVLGIGVAAVASDHDDGEADLKGRSLNITDVYAFREDNQTGQAGDAGNLVLIMNTNPRSLPGQQYFFSEKARYEFHLTRVSSKTSRPTGKDDIVLRFEFGAPGATNRQQMRFSWVEDGVQSEMIKTDNGGALLTSSLDDASKNALKINSVELKGSEVTVFAGLREDPFFFDVEQFFKVRSHAVKTGQFLGFAPANQARDFTKNYNVNAIVVKVPIKLLAKNNESVFDIWTTISVPK